MIINENDPRLVFIRIDLLSVPPEGIINHLKDRWWSCHPEKGLIFFKPRGWKTYPGSPQCNSSEAIADRLRGQLYPWAKTVFVPSVFYNINPHDY